MGGQYEGLACNPFSGCLGFLWIQTNLAPKRLIDIFSVGLKEIDKIVKIFP